MLLHLLLIGGQTNMLPILDSRPVLDEHVEEIAHREETAIDVVSRQKQDHARECASSRAPTARSAYTGGQWH